MKIEITTELQEFIDYCKSFYGEESDLFPLNKLTDEMLIAACFLISKRKDISFDGDTIDREHVRAILELAGCWAGDKPSMSSPLTEYRDRWSSRLIPWT
jgi:hypothetical protein